LISHEDFVETAKACIFKKSESFFQVFFTDVSMSKERTFNKFCRSINVMLVRAFLKRSKKGIGKYVLVYLQSAAFTSAINTFQAKEFRNRTCLGLVALALFQLYLKKLRDEVSIVAFAKWDNEGSEEVGSKIWQKQTKLLVNRFVGYALSRLIETTRNKQNRTEKHDTDLTYQQLELYRSMRIFHEDVLLLKAYCEEFYDGVSALQNNGFWALVAPEYFPFRTKVVEVIRRVVTMHRMRSEGNELVVILQRRVID
jgi:hypothetical protein